MPQLAGTSRGNFQAVYAVGNIPGLISHAQTIAVPVLDDEVDCHLMGVEVIDTSGEPPISVMHGVQGDPHKTTTYVLDVNVTVVLHYACP